MDYRAEYTKLSAERDKLLSDADALFARMTKLQFLIDHGSELKDEAKATLESGVAAQPIK